MFFNLFKRSEAPQEPQKRNKMPRSLSRFFGNGGRKSADIPEYHISGASLINLLHDKTLRQARPLAINNPVASGYLDTLKRNVIGSKGISFQSRVKAKNGDTDKVLNAKIEKAFKRWSKRGRCDVTGLLSFKELQDQAVLSVARDGNFLARTVIKNKQFLLQHLDSNLLATRHSNAELNIQNGIQTDEWGKPINYFFHKRSNATSMYGGMGGEIFSVPADEIIHLFIQDLPQQQQGLSKLKPAIFSLHNLQEMNDSTLRKARLSSVIANFLKYNSDTEPPEEDDEISEFQVDDISMPVLPYGMEKESIEHSFPGNEYSPFIKQQMRFAATGLGASYNDLASDAESVNFSSLRHFALAQRDTYMDWQEFIIENFCEIVFEKWIEFEITSGRLGIFPSPETIIDIIESAEFIGRRWDWVDPLKDTKSLQMQIQMGMKSLAKAIKERGEDPETVIDEIAETIKMMKEKGIPETMIVSVMGLAKMSDSEAMAILNTAGG